MEIDEIIDEELLALSDCSSDNEDYDSDIENKEIDVVASPEDVDYLQLFLQNSNLQFEKTDQVLCAAEDILKTEINNDDFDKNVIEKYLHESNENSDKENTELSPDGIENKTNNDEKFDMEGLEKRLQILTSSFVEQKTESEKRIEEFEVASKQEEEQTLYNLEANRQKAEEQMKLLECEEKRILLKLQQEKLFYEQQRKNKAACCIQCFYRGYLARKKYSEVLKERIAESKRKRLEERIAMIERRKESEIKDLNQSFTEELHEPRNNENFTNSEEENSDISETEKNVEIVENFSESKSLITKTNDQNTENVFLETHNLETNKTGDDLKPCEQNNISVNFGNDSKNSSLTEISEPENMTHYCDENPQSTDVINFNEKPQNIEETLKPELRILPGIESLHSENDPSFVEETTSNNSGIVKIGGENEYETANLHEAEEKQFTNLGQVDDIYESINETSSDEFELDEKEMKESDHKEYKRFEKENTFVVSNKSADSYSAIDLISKNHDTEFENQENEVGCLKEDKVDVQVIKTDDSQTNNSINISPYCQTSRIEEKTDMNPGQYFTDNDPVLLYNSSHEIGTTKKHPQLNNSTLLSDDVNLKDSNIEEEAVVNEGIGIISGEIFSCIDKKQEMDTGISNKNTDVVISGNTTLLPDNIIDDGTSVYFTSFENKSYDNDTDCFLTESSKPTPPENDEINTTYDKDTHSFKTEPSKPTPPENESAEIIEKNVPNTDENKPEVKPPDINGLVAASFAPNTDNLSVTLSENESEKSDRSLTRHDTSNIINTNETKIMSYDKKIQNSEHVHEPTDNRQDFESSFDKEAIEAEDFESKLTKWRSKCLQWREKECGLSVSLLRRCIRKSSAAKKLQPISQQQIIDGKWPTLRANDEDRSISTLSRIYISNLINKGSNLLLVQQCSHLTHLTLFKCGLISLEGLQACPSIRHINVSTNNISVMSCDGMKRLQSVVACDNALTSIHGLSGCHSLVYLDLSFNHITRVSGLEDLNNLLQLRLNNNQLIDLSGLINVNSLLSLDVSNNHLSSLDGIQQCGLLRIIQGGGNYFNSISKKEFENLVLLTSLDLSKNNLATFPPAELWLPCLTSINLQCNKITSENNELNLRQSFPSLNQLNLSQNLIAHTKPFLSGLIDCEGPPIKINLWENLLTNDQETDLMDFSTKKNFSFEFTENEHLKPKLIDLVVDTILGQSLNGENQDINTLKNSEFLKVILHDSKEFYKLLLLEKKEVRNMRGWLLHGNVENGKLFNYDELPPDLVSLHCETLQKQIKNSVKLRKWFESSNYIYFTDMKKSSLNKNIKENFYQNGFGGIDSNESVFLITQQKISAATLIQAHYKGFVCRKVFENFMKGRHISATLIQANWRGFCVRRTMRDKLSSGREPQFNNSNASCNKNISNNNRNMFHNIESNRGGNSYSNNGTSDYTDNIGTDDFDDDFGEVDLSEFHFNDDDFEKQWAYKTDVARQLMMSSVSSSNQNSLLTNNNINTEIDIPKPDTFSKTPLPPITPSSTRSTPHNHHRHHISRTITPSSDCPSYTPQESHRSKHSMKEERLTNEWGFKNADTAELMLKRARKMKGRHRKEVNAEVKLKRFQELSQKVTSQPLATSRRNSQSTRKMEYFKARDQAFERREKEPSEEDERKRQYTYEWLHTSANLTPENPMEHFGSRNSLKKRGLSQESVSVTSGFLPRIPKQRSLVQSPANNMEVMSISSYGSKRNRELLKDIVKRHGDNNEV